MCAEFSSAVHVRRYIYELRGGGRLGGSIGKSHKVELQKIYGGIFLFMTILWLLEFLSRLREYKMMVRYCYIKRVCVNMYIMLVIPMRVGRCMWLAMGDYAFFRWCAQWDVFIGSWKYIYIWYYKKILLR